MTIDPNNLAGTAHVTFDDEFNSLSLWNGGSGTWATDWFYDALNGAGTTLSSNGEQEWYVNNNYAATAGVTPWTVSNGMLNLTAAPASAAVQPLINNYKYTSGLLNTYHSFSQTYGYFEMNAKLPAGQGFWPAFWLLPENGGWPPELDIMEVLGNDPSTLYTTVHTGAANNSFSQANHVVDLSAGFHTYGVDWEPDYITWYLDGHAVYKTATPADMTGANASPMYMILNLAVGGYWPGNADSTTHFPNSMLVDWVRAYASGPDGATGSTGSSTGGSGSTSTGSGSGGTTSTPGQTLTPPVEEPVEPVAPSGPDA